jgi:hypothetical protein
LLFAETDPFLNLESADLLLVLRNRVFDFLLDFLLEVSTSFILFKSALRAHEDFELCKNSFFLLLLKNNKKVKYKEKKIYIYDN